MCFYFIKGPSAAAIMSKDKRVLGERSTNEAPIAPKLQAASPPPHYAYEVSIQRERKGGMCVHVAEGFEKLWFFDH